MRVTDAKKCVAVCCGCDKHSQAKGVHRCSNGIRDLFTHALTGGGCADSKWAGLGKHTPTSLPKRPVITEGGWSRLKKLVQVCASSGCAHYTFPGKGCASPGRCEWIAKNTRRHCSACYIEHLLRADFPPIAVCVHRRKAENNSTQGPQVTFPGHEVSITSLGAL